MLTRSFIHIPGIGSKTERSLWRAGVRSWRTFSQTRGEPAAVCVRALLMP